MRIKTLAILLLLSTTLAVADEKQRTRVRHMLVEGLTELREQDGEPLEWIQSLGLSAEDADRVLASLTETLVECALSQLQSTFEDTFQESLDALEHTLSEGRADAALSQLGIALGPIAETCAMIAMQEAGISIDMLPEVPPGADRDATN